MTESRYQPDEIDKQILDILKDNARIQWREIGEEIHLSGQAVGERVKRLMNNGVIEGYYTKINGSESGNVEFISIAVDRDHSVKFLQTMETATIVVEVYRMRDRDSYLLKAEYDKHDEIEELIRNLARFGEVEMEAATNRIK